MEITRREFVKLIGGVTGAIAIGGYGLNQLLEVPDEVIANLKNGLRIESWKNTICGLCPGGCGIAVRLINEIPVFVKGNPYYPINQGGMCPLGRGAIEHLFNPDRIKGPLRRIGIPGIGKWENISWNDSINIIVNKLRQLRDAGNSHKVAFLGYNENGVLKEITSRFMRAYGSNNYYRWSSFENNSIPFMLMNGRNQIPSYDILNTKTIVSLGANFLEEGYTPVYYTKIYSKLREATREKQVRFISADSRMSLTSANADKWIPIQPGTYGALALGIANVLIREELFDKEFIQQHTFGFEDWIDNTGEKYLGFKNHVLTDYYPEKVSNITSVPTKEIYNIARELGNNLPSIVIGDQAATDNTNGTFSQLAIFSLNALLGNFEKEGGLFYIDDPPFGKLPEIIEDSLAVEGNKKPKLAYSRSSAFPMENFSIDTFVKNILSNQPYNLEILFINKGNPVFRALNHHELIDALSKIPLVISFDSFINESNIFADLILPDHTFMEKWDLSYNIPTVGFSHIGIQQPVIKAIHDTRNTADVLIDISKKLGGSVSDSFPFNDSFDIVKSKMNNVYHSGYGSIVTERVRGFWLDYVLERGWHHVSRYSSFEEFWKLFVERGGWLNPVKNSNTISNIFKTPSGKFEFYSQILKESINIIQNENENVRKDQLYLPHHENVPSESGFNLSLITFQLLTNRDGASANLPILQEMFGYTVRMFWRSWAEISPQTAKEYGVSDGDMIWVESSIGSLKTQAKITPGIIPSVIAIPFGLGHTSYGRYANGHGVNPNSIMRNFHDTISGKPALQATKVKISLAK